MPTEIDTSLGLYDVAGRLAPLLFEHGAALPEGRRQALMTALNAGSPVDRLVGAMEALYGALKDEGEIPDVAAIVCGQCAFIVCANGFHGKTDRASKILQACRRMLGITANSSTPDPTSDPEPDPAPETPGE